MLSKLIRIFFFGLLILQLSFFNFDYKKPKPLELSHIKRISRTSYLIQHEYYDKKRIKPRDMLEEGFYELAKQIPEFLPKFVSNKTLYIQLGSKSTVIDLNDMNKLYDILYPVSEAFEFIKKNYKGESKFEDMEYAFIAGMLAVLDPHSNILPPKIYEEFQTQTQGHYGGLGIVIGMRDGDLTVVAPLDGTPASRVGIKAEDKIMQIDEQSTVNMTLSEAVELMRGPPQTDVVLKIKSAGTDSRFVTITREVIEIESVQSKVIETDDKNIGVLRIKAFQQDTYSKMLSELRELKKKKGKLDGIILDVRDNPGGLLDQAILISDKFLRSGAIVYTVGADDVNEDIAFARDNPDDIDLPVIVLINEGSASASEIVAGALRNNDRALVMGTRSFGKGSVQTLFPLRDGSTVKLTISQYLTPGKQSIQAVGIPPDVKVFPSLLTDEFFNLREDRFYSENELDSHLQNDKFIRDSKPFYSLTFLKHEKDEVESSHLSKIRDSDDDFLLSMAADVLAKAGHKSKKQALARALPILSQEAKAQDALVAEALSKTKNKIDWSNGENPSELKLSHRYLFVDDKGAEVQSLLADSEVTLKVWVKNESDQAVYRLIAEVDSFNPLINHKELVYGKLNPAEERYAEVTFKVPPEVIDFQEDAKLEFYKGHIGDKALLTKHIKTRLQEADKPRFIYSYQIFDGNLDKTSGNKNGVPNAGESVGIQIRVKNIGKVDSKETGVNIKNKEGQHVFLKTAREKIGLLKAGEEKTVTLFFDVKDSFREPDFELDVFAIDTYTKSLISDTLKFTLNQAEEPSPKFGEWQHLPSVQVLKTEKKDKNFRIVSEAEDSESLKDVSIFVNGKKYYYVSLNRKQKSKKKSIDLTVPLEKGLNYIVIQARGHRDLLKQKNVSVVYDQK